MAIIKQTKTCKFSCIHIHVHLPTPSDTIRHEAMSPSETSWFPPISFKGSDQLLSDSFETY